jgi:Mn-containing catalase
VARCPLNLPDGTTDAKYRYTSNKNQTGFTQTITRYQATNCNGCPLRGAYHKSKGNRVIEVNHNLNQYKEQVRENLNSEQGINHRKKHPCDVEPVFCKHQK